MDALLRKATVLFFCLMSLSLFANTEDILDGIYGEKEIPLLQGSWLVLAGAGVIDESTDASAAMGYLEEKGWDADSVLTRGKFSLLLMDNFPIPRGVMYRVTGWEHYALKDLLYLNILSGTADGSSPVSGFDLIGGLTNVLEEL